MNMLGIALLWCVVQVTAIGLVAGGIYLLLRRLRPAAGAPAVLSGLVMVVMLSLLAISPWPRWSIGGNASIAESRDVSRTAAADAGNGPLATDRPGTGSKSSADNLPGTGRVSVIQRGLVLAVRIEEVSRPQSAAGEAHGAGPACLRC